VAGLVPDPSSGAGTGGTEDLVESDEQKFRAFWNITDNNWDEIIIVKIVVL